MITFMALTEKMLCQPKVHSIMKLCTMARAY